MGIVRRLIWSESGSVGADEPVAYDKVDKYC